MKNKFYELYVQTIQTISVYDNCRNMQYIIIYE